MADTKTAKRKLTDAEKKARAEQRKADVKSGAKFQQLANRRVNAVLKGLRSVSMTARYPHTEDQGAKIIAALTEGIVAVRASFDGTKSDSESFSV